ncbi:hypothetical protein [Mariprofundus sp. KV]|uniref:hypothetical protein n=1 Tax=Mariprofundus sp. KV TaxID=2608715 RepID=UPI0015A3D3DC|nr:hypothetical protein [Mariprofundus sp. KV]NWF37503.1 hypothetical protein [Mariprofundus sp. KV]
MNEIVTKTWFSPSKIPSGDRLIPFISREKPLMIRFPALFSARLVEDHINWLKEELPEHYEVVDAGSTSMFHRITIAQLISEDEVMAVADALVAAAIRFARDATELAYRVAEANGIEADALAEHMFTLDHSPEGWDLFPHGKHLRCSDLESGQEVEISLAGNGFAMLDAEFFCRYLETTPGFELPEQFLDPAADMERAFDILERNGKFRGG